VGRQAKVLKRHVRQMRKWGYVGKKRRHKERVLDYIERLLEGVKLPDPMIEMMRQRIYDQVSKSLKASVGSLLSSQNLPIIHNTTKSVLEDTLKTMQAQRQIEDFEYEIDPVDPTKINLKMKLNVPMDYLRMVVKF